MATHGIGKWYVEIRKQAFWRGKPHTWVNRYVMTGEDPTSEDATTVINAIKTIEDQLHPNFGAGHGVGFVSGSAYGAAGGPPLVIVPFNITQSAGTATGFLGAQWTGATQTQGQTLEVCMMLETPVIGLSSTGKPITLRKYYRGAFYGTNEDTGTNGIPAADITGIKALTAPFFSGLGGTAYVVTTPSGLRTAAGFPAPYPFMCNRQITKGRKKKKSVVTEQQSTDLLSFFLDGLKDAGGVAIKAAGDA